MVDNIIRKLIEDDSDAPPAELVEVAQGIDSIIDKALSECLTLADSVKELDCKRALNEHITDRLNEILGLLHERHKEYNK